MSGAMRKHAPSSTRLTGLVSATALTLAMGYVFANAMGVNISRLIPDPITYVALPEPKQAEPPPTTPEMLDTQTDLTPVADPIDLDIPTFVTEEAVFTPPDSHPQFAGKAGSEASVAPPRVAVRTAAKMLPAASPLYPASEMRKGNEGVTRLEVCLDANGRVTSATLAGSSNHPALDRTALAWVRDRKFMPAKVDGVPQPVCGHGVDYEWKLNR